MFQLLKDFCYIYPQNKECLFENFPIYKAKILELANTASTTLRDTTLKNIIKQYLDLAPGTLYIFIYKTQNYYFHFLCDINKTIYFILF